MNNIRQTENKLVTIIGPTASGKTTFATQLACTLDGEIISGDSRQIYRGMDIGTGKDLADYIVDGTHIPYHLIDIREAGEKYTLFDFQQDFHAAYQAILARDKQPILCGGTGLYIEAVLKGYRLLDVPQNPALREELEQKPMAELIDILRCYKTLHNTTDIDTKKRVIRAIEIEKFQQAQAPDRQSFEKIDSLIFGIDIGREARRKKISERLRVRLKEGMVEEIRQLIAGGVSPEDLIYYGLEYKFVTQYVLGEITYDEMQARLEIAIHQFAKRQMTWFRGMERRGFTIHWLEAALPMHEKIEKATLILTKKS